MMALIRFLLGSETIDVPADDGQIMLLEWLRVRRLRTGTKEGCNEGDCGACTVIVTRLEGGRATPRAVNACLVTMASLHGAHLITVEDLENDATLHPVQQAMVSHHGSQCGFCTPGFIMSMATLHHENAPGSLARDDIARALSGNLCRCTGYAPIIRAMEASLTEVHPLFDAAHLTARLTSLQEECLTLDADRCSVPRTLDEAIAALDRHDEPTIVAGMTDVGIWTNKQLRDLPHVVNVSLIDELQEMDETATYVEIGGALTWQAAYESLIRHFPGMTDMLDRFASLPIRNRATIGGNLANGSPVGDGPPALMALGTEIELASASGVRTLSLDDFYLSYGVQDRQPSEILSKIRMRKLDAGDDFRVYKVSKRIEQDISAILGAFRLRREEGTIVSVRIAFGGMAATPKRAIRTEKALVGQVWNEATLLQAAQALKADFQPIDDHRATARYRMLVAKNLLMRLYQDVGP